MPCRVCTANDEDALIDEIATAVWESSRHRDADMPTWAEAGDDWQSRYRRHVRSMLRTVRLE